MVRNTQIVAQEFLRPQNIVDENVAPQELGEILAELAALDGLSILQITKSMFIRDSLLRRGFTISTQPRDVMKMIRVYRDKVKETILQKIQRMKNKNQKFSQSIDEWTSFRNRRYLNVHLYYEDGDSDNLGLIRITGTATAEVLLGLLKKKLESYGLDMQRDIVVTTSDGASVMKKLGRLSAVNQQLCYNHGIHLAVVKVLYKKKNNTQSAENISDDEIEFEEPDEFETEVIEEDYSEVFIDQIEEEDDDVDNELTNQLNTLETVNRCRDIVKLFKRSPSKNEILQKYVKLVEGKELQVLLDLKIRWSSLEKMLTRFIRILKPIEDTLDDINRTDMWEPENTETAEAILKILEPLSMTVNQLSHQNFDLLQAEGVL
jgi:hypothetical protein